MNSFEQLSELRKGRKAVLAHIKNLKQDIVNAKNSLAADKVNLKAAKAQSTALLAQIKTLKADLDHGEAPQAA